MNIFELKNKACAKMEVQLEPWAEVYYLRKGDTIKFEQSLDEVGYYTVWVTGVDSMQVFPEGFLDYPAVFINDQPAEPWNDFVVDPTEPVA
jgi:hypothetical protein